MGLTTTEWILIGIGVVVLLLIMAAVMRKRQVARTEALRDKFGPEYDKVVEEIGDRGRAEQELVARTERVRQLDLRPLATADQARFSRRWQAIQARFVEHPSLAVSDAQWLVEEVMRLRGYPVDESDHPYDDLTVRYPSLANDLRAARDAAASSETGRASTEDLRQAFVHYRNIFSALLGTSAVQA